MSHAPNSDDAGLAKLRSLMLVNIAVEEAFISALSDLSRDRYHQMDASETEMVLDLIRRHRVGLIKQRAIMGAIDIDV